MDIQELRELATTFREKKEVQWEDNQAPYGVCVETSEELQALLQAKNIQSELVEGWWAFDDPSYNSNRPYGEHTCLKVFLSDKVWYVDITADQFSFYMDVVIPKVYLSDEVHDAFYLNEPLFLFEDEEFEDEEE